MNMPRFTAEVALYRTRNHYYTAWNPSAFGGPGNVGDLDPNSIQAALELVIDGVPVGEVTGIDDINGIIYYDPFFGGGPGGGNLSDPNPRPPRTGCCQWRCPSWCARPTAWGICPYCCIEYQCEIPCVDGTVPRPPRVNPIYCRRGGNPGPCSHEADLCPR